MTWKIGKLEKGKKPTLLQAKKGNELIKALNALSNLRIEKGARDEVIYGDEEVIITYGSTARGITVTCDPTVSLSNFTFQDGLLTNVDPV